MLMEGLQLRLEELVHFSRPSQVFGSIQIIPQGLYQTQGPDFSNSLFTIVVKAGIVTGDTLWEPSLASWFLAKVTFSHRPKLDTCLQPRHGFR